MQRVILILCIIGMLIFSNCTDSKDYKVPFGQWLDQDCGFVEIRRYHGSEMEQFKGQSILPTYMQELSDVILYGYLDWVKQM